MKNIRTYNGFGLLTNESSIISKNEKQGLIFLVRSNIAINGVDSMIASRHVVRDAFVRAIAVFESIGSTMMRTHDDYATLCENCTRELDARLRPAPTAISTANVTASATSFAFKMESLIQQSHTSKSAYYYHGDHLGGAAWITDGTGLPVQHLQYHPFGEPYVNQRATGSTYNERYTFTGKERDEETGYSDHGARYLDHALLTSWLSPDPLADKYPNISPYAYCAWNPVACIDIHGDSITLSKDAWIIQKEAFLSLFDRKDVNIPFSYDEKTKKMSFTGLNDDYEYSDIQNEIIDHYKSLCNNVDYNVNVQVVDNDDLITTNAGTTSLREMFAMGLTIHHENNTADVYISKWPLFMRNGEITRRPNKDVHQSISILHEIGGHAYYHSQNIHGTENNQLTTIFENKCRAIFRASYRIGTRTIRNEKARYEH